MNREPSSCSCALPNDMYGLAGFHHRVADLRYWCNRIWNDDYGARHAAYRRPGGSVPDHIREEITRRARTMPASVAVERCPHYREACAQGIARDKGAKAREKSRANPEEWL